MSMIGAYMTACAELEFGISAISEQRFSIRARFWEPDNVVENNLGMDSPVEVSFNFQNLNSLVLSPKKYW